MKISQIIPEESGSKRKNDTQQEHVWHLNNQPQDVPELKKGGLKDDTSLLTLDRRMYCTEQIVRVDKKEQIKAPWHWPLVEGIDRWIPFTQGQ